MNVVRTWGAAALLAGVTGLFPNDIPLQPIPGTPPDAYLPEPVPLRASSPAPGDRFGAALAGSPQRLLVGAPGAGETYVFSAGPTEILLDPDGAFGNDFGAAVASSGGTLAVGAPGGTGGGAVHVFEPSGIFRRTLANPAGLAGDRFGTSIVITTSERLLVGAPAVGTGRSGAAFVFSPSGALLATLASPNPTPDDGFGATVAVIGSTALVAAPFDDTTVTDAGAVYLFDVSPGSPTFGALVRGLQKPAPATGDGFGTALAVTERTIFVGAPFDDGIAPDAGAVHLFATDNGDSLGMLPGASPHGGDGFGTSLAVVDFVDPAVGALLAVGAPADDTAVMEGGAVHLFVYPATATDAHPMRVITRPGAAAFDAFGYGLAFSGDANDLTVGIPGDAGTAGAAQRFLPTCGDGDVDTPQGEQCDDDGNLDDDGCSGQCLNEPCSCGGDCDSAEETATVIRMAALTNGGVCDCASTAGKDCSDGGPEGGTGDGLSCTSVERCTAKAGLCVGTVLNDSLCEDDGNPCTIARCDPSGPPPTGCVQDQVSCDDADPCTDDTCDPTTGGCQNLPRDCTCDADTDCDDGNSCNGRERCFSCPQCDITNRFGCCDSRATCSGGTVPAPESPCDDDSLCTTNDRCDAQLRCTGDNLLDNAFVTIGCVLEQTPCPESRPTQRLQRLLRRARRLIARAVDNPTERRISKAETKIALARDAASSAGARGKLPPECVDLWIALLNDALARLQAASP